jgi:hypothetical protein
LGFWAFFLIPNSSLERHGVLASTPVACGERVTLWGGLSREEFGIKKKAQKPKGRRLGYTLKLSTYKY